MLKMIKQQTKQKTKEKKMKKTLLGIAGILAMISSANAADTAQIKAACQSSSKTLWVERNQVCIPRNPCGNPNFDQYCNRDFANIQLVDREYESIVNYYADVNNLDCKVVPQRSSFVGQDYIVCMGKDVMVFEFDDIKDSTMKVKDCLSDGARTALCTIMGVSADPMGGGCYGTKESICLKANKHLSFGETMDDGTPLPYAGWNENDQQCSLGCPGRYM
jgi:hypothetical protein